MQEERQRVKEKGDGEVESTSGCNNDMPTEQILEAELAVEPGNETYIDVQVCRRCVSASLLHSSPCVYVCVVQERERET